MTDVRGACALYYQYDIKNASGKRVKRSRRRTSHSFLKQYIVALNTIFVSTTAQTLTDTAGTTTRTINRDDALGLNAGAGTDTYGLVVGTGTGAVTITDTKLGTQIAHGTGSGQLSYSASVNNAPSSDSTSTTLILTRVFTNGSGGTITIKEIGIYCLTYDTGFYFCLVRDLATIAMAAGDQLTLNYILKTTS